MMSFAFPPYSCWVTSPVFSLPTLSFPFSSHPSWGLSTLYPKTVDPQPLLTPVLLNAKGFMPRFHLVLFTSFLPCAFYGLDICLA